MKCGSKRRRGKQELKEQRRQEGHHQSEIAAKLARIQELEHCYSVLKSQAEKVQQLEGNIQTLVNNGLLHCDG